MPKPNRRDADGDDENSTEVAHDKNHCHEPWPRQKRAKHWQESISSWLAFQDEVMVKRESNQAVDVSQNNQLFKFLSTENIPISC